MGEEIIESRVVKDILKVVENPKKTAHHLEKFAAELMSNMRKDIKSENSRISKSKSNGEEVDMKILLNASCVTPDSAKCLTLKTI